MHSGGRVGAAFGDVSVASILREGGKGGKVVVARVVEPVFRER